MAEYKFFNGKKYTFAANLGSKKQADFFVKIHKENGELVRMTKYLDKISKKYRYEVWARKGK